MKITLSLADDLVSTARNIAAERGMSLNDLIRNYLEQSVAQNPSPVDNVKIVKAKAIEALNQSFQNLQFSMGKREWKTGRFIRASRIRQKEQHLRPDTRHLRPAPATISSSMIQGNFQFHQDVLFVYC